MTYAATVKPASNSRSTGRRLCQRTVTITALLNRHTPSTSTAPRCSGTITCSSVLTFCVMAEFCIICAAPRSGTTVLSDAVSAAYQVACPSEVFHELYTTVDLGNPDWEQAGNFFAFRNEALR